MPTTKTLKKQYSTPAGAATQKRVQSMLGYHPHGPVLLWGYGAPYAKENVTLMFEDPKGEKKLPYGDNAFAQVILIHVLENAPDPAAVLQEAHRVLQGQGSLSVIVPQKAQPGTPFEQGNRFTAEQLKFALTVDFHHITIQGCKPVVGRWWPQLCPVLMATAHKQQVAGLKIPSVDEVLPRLRSPKPAGACRTRLHTL